MCEPFYKKTRVGAGEELTRVVFLMRGHGKRQREARQATTGTYPSGQRSCAANLRSGRAKGARPTPSQPSRPRPRVDKSALYGLTMTLPRTLPVQSGDKHASVHYHCARHTCAVLSALTAPMR